MRWLVVAVVASISLLLLACGGGAEVAPDAERSGNGETIARDQLRLLAEGEFIDSNLIEGTAPVDALTSFPGDGSLAAFVAYADAVVVGEVTEVTDVVISTSPAPPNWPVSEVDNPPWTTYRVRVDQWLKGSEGAEILVGQSGGMTPYGPYFFDGDFLLEPGRKYVLILVDRHPLQPGPGKFAAGVTGRSGFEVTDGSVHVLNHPIAQELQTQFGGMPLQEFVGVLRGYVANPPPPPTPRPTPAEIGPPPTTSLVVNSVGIDTDIKRTAANTATSLGSLKRCNTLTSGGSLTIDIAADGVPLVGDAGGGIIAFQFVLHYDPAKVKVSASNHDMLLAANAGSSLVSLGDATPDADGSFLVAVTDFGLSTTPESGSGVLARITLEGVAPGVSSLTLTDVAIADVSNARYGINSTPAAEVAVDAGCPP